MEKTSTGLEQNIAGLLCYVLGWLTGLIFFLIEKENKFVRFHALQSLITSGAITIVHMIVWNLIITNILLAISWRMWWLTSAVSTILGLGHFALIVFLIYKAYSNEMFKVPIAGDIAEKNA